MELVFKYGRFDRRSRRITLTITIVVLLGLGAIAWFDNGSYLMALFLVVVVAVVLLYALSIPRKITVDRDDLKIHCVLELTTIPLCDIRSIRKVTNRRMKYTFPLLGSYGFFGYYGYYFNLRKWEMVKLYARQWGDFVEIESIYEDIYIVSCPDCDQLVAAVRQVKSGNFDLFNR